MYYPTCLNQFPKDLADSLLTMALERLALTPERLSNLTESEKQRLDEMAWRLVTAADVSDTPCGD